MKAPRLSSGFFFFFNDTATTEIYTLSLHDALPISFLGPRLQLGERQLCLAAPLDRGADPLSPLGIVHADHGALRDRRMRPEHLLHLERRHLVTAGLDDVYARAAEHPVCALFRDGDVAGAEPAVPERCSSRVGPPP